MLVWKQIATVAFEGVTNAVYRYLGAGRVIGREGGNNLIPEQTTVLDRFGRVEDLQWRTDGTLVERFQYTHDRLGRRVTRTQPLNTSFSEEYQYDAFSQLVAMDRANGDAQDWDLEHIGNWRQFTTNTVAQTRTHNAGNEITAIDNDSGAVLHDSAGNMTRIPAAAGQPGGIGGIGDG